MKKVAILVRSFVRTIDLLGTVLIFEGNKTSKMSHLVRYHRWNFICKRSMNRSIIFLLLFLEEYSLENARSHLSFLDGKFRVGKNNVQLEFFMVVADEFDGLIVRLSLMTFAVD